MNMMSSLSKRLKMRRNPLSRRNGRSDSFRRRYQALLHDHGSRRVESGGTTGVKPSSRASCRVSLPSYARSMIGRQRRGRAARVCSSSRPAGRRIRLSGRERERHGRARIRGNQMNLGGPSAAGLAHGLRPWPSDSCECRWCASCRNVRATTGSGTRARRSSLDRDVPNRLRPWLASADFVLIHALRRIDLRNTAHAIPLSSPETASRMRRVG